MKQFIPQISNAIHRFSNDYPHVQIITTSRRLGYKGERLRNAGFRHFMLQDLEIDQIKEFIEHWHELTFEDQSDKVRKKKRLIQAIEDSKAIRELAGNPLLLTMMAILNRNQELPKDRSKLYEKASEILLYKWDIDGKVELKNPTLKDWKVEISLSDKQKMLRKVAYFMQSNKQDTSGNLISKSDLENILTESLREIIERGEPRMIARVIIEELRTRNFILCFLGADSYGFVHRTFLEYFCAWEFVWQFKEDQTLTINGLINQIFGTHWQDESWHEVLRLICGMIEPKFVAKIINFLLNQKINRSDYLDGNGWIKKEGFGNLVLATNCFAEVRNRNLIATNSEQLLKILKGEIEQKSEPCFYWEVGNNLITLIATIWQEHPETLSWLKNCAVLDEDLAIRHAAIQEISTVWRKDPDTLTLLQDRALQDESRYVRQLAVNTIAKDWKEDPNTLALLKNRALKDENRYVRQDAVHEIAKHWKEYPNTLNFVKERALQDEDCWVQHLALSEIAHRWKEDPDTLAFLKDRALLDENFIVRETTIPLIAKEWKEFPDTLLFLTEYALKDESERVRQVVVEMISEYWKEEPEILILLKKCVLEDEDWMVREIALKAIIKEGKKDIQTFNFLYDRIISDPFQREYHLELHPLKPEYYLERNPRQTALEGLLKNFGDDPKILEILNQVALNDSDEKLREFAVEKLQNLKNTNP